eukprot:snap_masked-scaffold_70-processed-gene-0.31-mRNA-1 protein AED:0.41 eAED:0.43 QI:0/0/0/0.5/1/1/2/0/113
MTLSECLKKVRQVYQLFKCLQVDIATPIETEIDNQAAIKLIKYNRSIERTKYLDVGLMYTRDMVKRGLVRVSYVKSADDTADVMTKACSAGVCKSVLPMVVIVYSYDEKLGEY